MLERRGITTRKKDGIIEVLKGVPQEKMKFWASLPVNENVPDLQESREEEEDEGIQLNILLSSEMLGRNSSN